MEAQVFFRQPELSPSSRTMTYEGVVNIGQDNGVYFVIVFEDQSRYERVMIPIDSVERIEWFKDVAGVEVIPPDNKTQVDLPN